MHTYLVSNIKWDTSDPDYDGRPEPEFAPPDLPETVEIQSEEEMDDDDISDWLSNAYGFCHDGFEYHETKKTKKKEGETMFDKYIQAIIGVETAYRSLLSAASELPSGNPKYKTIAKQAKAVRKLEKELMELALIEEDIASKKN